ncbi:MAG: cell division protein FtsA [Bryobacteraceae bacterium]|jgi:cell division protein FtsA
MAEKQILGVGLDAASRETRMVICALEDGRLRLLGCAARPSRGWLKGRIADQKAVADSILAVLREAEAAAGVSVESAVVGMGGPTVRGANTRGVLDLEYIREIEQRDIRRVMERASHVQLQEDRMVLQLFPQDFVVDEHPGHSDPRRMMASKLEVNVHVVTASVQEHAALIGAVNQAHLAVEETVFEALAACYAAVLPEERREGIAVVDIGAESTEMVAYWGDSLYLASTVRVCGDHFTRDLAQGLFLTFDEAEALKLEYGGALAEACPENILVDLPTPGGGERRAASGRFINQILEARGQELFLHVQSELARVGMENALLGVFLTGGGAKLPDLCHLAKGVLQCHALSGQAVGIDDAPAELSDPAWCVASGLAMYSAKLKTKERLRRETAGWLGKILK